MPIETSGSESEKSQAMEASENRLRWHAFMWMLSGAVLILLDAVIELYSKSGIEAVDFVHLFVRLLEGFGIASIIFGIFNVFIEMPDLRKYFLERMRELVSDQAYLSALSRDELWKIEGNALKAHYRNDDILKEGGFFGFLRHDIYPYINAPFRERVTLEIRYAECGDGLFLAKDRLSYICRKSGGVDHSFYYMAQ